jgi:hypothetical protein
MRRIFCILHGRVEIAVINITNKKMWVSHRKIIRVKVPYKPSKPSKEFRYQAKPSKK